MTAPLAIVDPVLEADPERQYLAAVLSSDALAPEDLDAVPLDFADERHRQIFAAALGLVHRGEVVDLLTVRVELRRRGRLDAAGGPGYLAELTDVPTEGRLPHAYLPAVKSEAKRRALKVAVAVAAEDLRTGVDAADVAANIKGAVVFQETDQPDEWAARKPLPPLTEPVPTLSPELLPESLRDWLADSAERLGVVIEFVAAPALVMAGSLLGRNLTIRPKARDSWTEVPNIWGMAIGRPSSMKTPSIGEATRLVRALAQEADRTWRAAMAIQKARGEVLAEKRRGALKRAAKDGADDASLAEEVADLDRKIEAARLAARRVRYVVNDATQEALHVILEENPRGVAMVRDELPGLIASLDREGYENYRSFLLECWSGGTAGGYESDRIIRGNTAAPGPCLSIFGGAQPGKVAPLVRGATSQGEKADGFIQRFQLVVWPDDATPSPGIDRAPDRKAFERALSVFRALDSRRPEDFGATLEEGSLPFLRFGREAQELFDDWLRSHRDRTRAADLEKCPAFEGHLTKYRKLVPALALIFHALAIADGEKPGPVSAEALDLSFNWADFLELHARKLYHPELRGDATAAHALAEKIKTRAVVDGMGVRDITERDWSSLTRAGYVHAGLDILEAAGWVRRQVEATGGRSKTTVRLHPDFRRPE
jgi:hypothetical protein